MGGMGGSSQPMLTDVPLIFTETYGKQLAAEMLVVNH